MFACVFVHVCVCACVCMCVNFIKRYVVERTDKAEIRPEEQSEKVQSCENIWNEIQLPVYMYACACVCILYICVSVCTR